MFIDCYRLQHQTKQNFDKKIRNDGTVSAFTSKDFKKTAKIQHTHTHKNENIFKFFFLLKNCIESQIQKKTLVKHTMQEHRKFFLGGECNGPIISSKIKILISLITKYFLSHQLLLLRSDAVIIFAIQHFRVRATMDRRLTAAVKPPRARGSRDGSLSARRYTSRAE